MKKFTLIKILLLFWYSASAPLFADDSKNSSTPSRTPELLEDLNQVEKFLPPVDPTKIDTGLPSDQTYSTAPSTSIDTSFHLDQLKPHNQPNQSHSSGLLGSLPGQQIVPFEDYSECLCGVYPLMAELSHIEGKGVGYNTGYSTLSILYMPQVYQKIQPFVDLREHCFNDSKLASNVGLGVRYLDPCRKIILGANFYYDYRRIHRSDAQQFGGGLEFLSDLVDFRFNGYFPFGRQTIHHHERFHQKVYSGVDVEVGMFFKRKRVCDWYSLYGAVGFYQLSKSGGNHAHVSGEKGRLALQLMDWLRLEVSGSYDKLYKGIVQGLIAIDCPIWDMLWTQCEDNVENSCSCETECRFRELLVQRVYRQEMIVESKKRH